MTQPSGAQPSAFSPNTSTAIVRYQVQDVDRAITFYTQHLGFHLTRSEGLVIAIVSRGKLDLLLSGPKSSGARPMPDGRQQEPGGWNRIVLYVDSIDSTIAALKDTGHISETPSRSGPAPWPLDRIAPRSWGPPTDALAGP